MRLSDLVASLAGACFVLADEKFLVTEFDPKVCFPYVENTPATLILNVTEYTATENFDEMQSKFHQEKTVQLIAFRKSKMDFSQQFHGEHTRLRHCVPEAVSLGFCQEEDLGKFLYKMNEDGDAPLVNGIFKPFNATDESQSSVSISEITEKGNYCIQSSSRWAERYKVEVTIKDGHSLKRQTRNTLVISSLVYVLDIVLLLLLALPWVGIPMPHIVKWQVFLRVVAFIPMTWGTFENWKYDFGHLGMDEGNSFAYDLVHGSINLWVHTFVYYQYSGDFTYNKITELDGTKLFIILQLTLVYDFLLGGMKYKTGKYLSDFVAPVVATTLGVTMGITSALTKAYVYFRMFRKYSQSVKLFTDFNKFKHPTLKQFRSLFWLDWFRTFVLPLIFLAVSGIQDELLNKVSTYYTENYTIDGNPYDTLFRSMLFSVAISDLLQGYVLWTYWTPQYFEKVEKHKERDD